MSNLTNIKVDKMRFQNNSRAYLFGLLAILTAVIALFALITPPSVKPSYSTAIEIGLNIILILAMFLAAEKSKVYQRQWGIGSLILAGIHFVRMFIEPIAQYRKGISSFNAASEADIAARGYNLWNNVPEGLGLYNLIVVLLFTGITVALLVFSGILTIKKHAQLEAYKKELGE